MIDESRDVSDHKQFTMVLCVIDFETTTKSHQSHRSYSFKGYFPGFIKLEDFDTPSLTNKTVKLLTNSSFNIDKKQCIAVSFDGQEQ